MADLELRRDSHDRRSYVLPGIGTLRLAGLASRSAVAEADGATWQISRRGFWQRSIEATDAEGRVAGLFEPNALRRGGRLRWDGRELELRPASSWKERYSLADGTRELALLDGKGWGSRRVVVTVSDESAIDPGLLLFAAFVVRGLAGDADTAAAAGATTAATGG
jgi:hypothetical protein